MTSPSVPCVLFIDSVAADCSTCVCVCVCACAGLKRGKSRLLQLCVSVVLFVGFFFRLSLPVFCCVEMTRREGKDGWISV